MCSARFFCLQISCLEKLGAEAISVVGYRGNLTKSITTRTQKWFQCQEKAFLDGFYQQMVSPESTSQDNDSEKQLRCKLQALLNDKYCKYLQILTVFVEGVCLP